MNRHSSYVCAVNWWDQWVVEIDDITNSKKNHFTKWTSIYLLINSKIFVVSKTVIFKYEWKKNSNFKEKNTSVK